MKKWTEKYMCIHVILEHLRAFIFICFYLTMQKSLHQYLYNINKILSYKQKSLCTNIGRHYVALPIIFLKHMNIV